MKLHPRERSTIAAARHLAGLGYSIAFRRNVWWECLLAAPGERWIGQGRTRVDALQHALDLALPSHAARELLRRSVAANPGSTSSSGPPAAQPSTNGEPNEVDAATLCPPTPPESAGVVAPVHENAQPAPEPAPSPLKQVDVPASPRRIARRPPEELSAHYDEIDDEIDATQEEAGLLAPEHQRRLLLAWIASARGAEADSAGSRAAFERTRAIAQRCSRLAKIWWPGSVRALGIDATPRDAAGELPADPAADLSNWTGVARAAESALEALEMRPDRDEHGWADAEALRPAHSRPDAVLAEVVAHLEKLTGRVLRPSDRGECRAELPAGFDARKADLSALAGLVRKVRWLRGSVSDLELWGAAIGRLRWLAERLQRSRGDLLLDLLAPGYRPPRSWAQEVGHDPDKKRRQRERKSLVSEPPQADWDPARLRGWLLRAFDLGSELQNDRIAMLCAPASEALNAIAAPGFSDKRKHRTRLEAVQRHLRQGSEPAEAVPLEPLDDEVAEESASYFDRLVEVIAPHTRGRRALFVSNRNDPTIDALVRERFGFEEVDHCEVKSANVSAKAASIERGTYDFVLAATGFLPHRVDGVLKASARQADVPYVSVYRGRPLSVARALARELGVGVSAV